MSIGTMHQIFVQASVLLSDSEHSESDQVRVGRRSMLSSSMQGR